MRRVEPVTKEAFLWVRAQVTKSREMQEHWEELGGTSESVKEIVEVNEALIDSLRNTLSKLVSLELQWLFDEFNISKRYVMKSGTAFPGYSDEVGLDESIVEYCNDLVGDVIECYTIPAMQLADEFEEWVGDLYEYHADQRDKN